MKTQCNFVNGEWAEGGDAIENRSPSDVSDVVGLFAQADGEQADNALAAARKAQPIWAAVGMEKRQAALAAVGNQLIARAGEIGELLSREEGKPRAEGVGETFRAGQFFAYFAAEVLRVAGLSADSVRDGVEIQTHREPVGVVAVVSPWNFPIATASWKIAPALAFGNAVVWKPANLTPAVAVKLAEIIAAQKDIPPGAFNLVMGGGDSVGERIVSSPKTDAVSFTGSLETGRRVAQAAAKNLTKLQMEMGSKNPLVVMDDADLDLAVACAVNGAFGGTGQKCTASSRLVVHEKIHDAFVEKTAEATRALKVGHALAAETQIGPVVSAAQMESNFAYLELAEKEGAKKICGGEKLKMESEGYYMSPALLTEGDNAMRINREEMFAPVACVIRARSYEEALEIANDSDYGLTAGIVTRSFARAAHFRRNAKSGCVMVNLPTAGTDYHVPFGGRKMSSHGPREQGGAAVEFYTTIKTAYSRPGSPE